VQRFSKRVTKEELVHTLHFAECSQVYKPHSTIHPLQGERLLQYCDEAQTDYTYKAGQVHFDQDVGYVNTTTNNKQHCEEVFYLIRGETTVALLFTVTVRLNVSLQATDFYILGRRLLLLKMLAGHKGRWGNS
jgi:hypothetical protein